MSAAEPDRKPSSSKAKTGSVLWATVAAVAVAVGGGLVTAFSYAGDPAKTNVNAQLTNCDLESKKPLNWKGMPVARMIIGVDPMNNQLAPYNITKGDNYVPVMIEERAPDGTTQRHLEMALLKGVSFNDLTKTWTIESVALVTSFTDMDKWARRANAWSQDDPAEAVRQANRDNLPDFAQRVGPAYPVSLVVALEKPTYHANANTQEIFVSFSVSQINLPKDPQTGREIVPAAPYAEAGLGQAMMDNWLPVEKFYEYLRFVDNKIEAGVGGRLAEMADRRRCIDETTLTMPTLYAMEQVPKEITNGNGTAIEPFALRIIKRARELYAQQQPNMTGPENASGFSLIPTGLAP